MAAAMAPATQLLLIAVVLLSLFHCLYGACETEKFGGNCQHECHCKNQTTCHPDSGECDSQGCQDDYKGISCQKYSVARLGAANSSAYWSPPEMAIDGQIPAGGFTACFHSADGQQFYPAWWRVDLGAVYPMDDIDVYYFHDQGGDRSSGMILNILNSTDGPAQHCLTYNTPNQTKNNFSCGQSGRILELRRLNWTIAVCEVQVFVCLPNTYGDQCTPCGQCQEGEECDRSGGACPRGCASGWGGPTCNAACSPGTYGHSCNTTCGQCAQGPCDRETGLCSGGCQRGWKGPQCHQQCSGGTFGPECTACGHCLGCAQCDIDTGGCPQGCTPGWTGEKCDVMCPSGSFGAFCSLACGRCHGNASCHHVTGICPDGCQDGWEGPVCSQPSPQQQVNDRFAAGIGVGVGISFALMLLVAVIVLLVKRRYKAGDDGNRSREKQAEPQDRTREMTIVNSSAETPPVDADQRPYDSLEATQREATVPHPYEGMNHYQN